jgi:lycopene cyclase domain-containing protein
MSYLAFDLLLVALPAVLLLLGRSWRPVLGPVAVLAPVALLWTAPWDEHLVRTGVWTYAPDAVVARIGSVPAEEYGFVVLEVLLVAAWAVRVGALPPRPVAEGALVPGARSRGALLWLAVTAAGVALAVAGGSLRYLGLLLLWVGPPMALQRAVAGDLLRARRRSRVLVALPVALWLCAADRLALADGIWAITPASSTGVLLLGLPLEEALFFLLTCALVADGLLLAADPRARSRAQRLLVGRLAQAAATTSRTSRTARRRLAAGPSAPTGSRAGTSAGIVSGTWTGAGSGSSADRLSLTSRRTSDSRTPRARQMLASSSDDASFCPRSTSDR